MAKNYNKYPFMNLSLDDMEGEEWRDIPSFDGYFLVSNYGRIWALARPVYTIDGHFYYTKERIRKQHLAKYYNSYTKDYTEQLSVHLRYQGGSYTFKVNRLVYALFVKPINIKEDGLLVVHKDGDNCNNRVDNLALMNGTQLYAHGLNLDRRPRSGKMTRKKNQLVWSDKNSPRPIVQYTLAGKKVNEFESVAQAANAIGSHRGSIRDVAAKKLKQLHGFVYRYKGDRYRGEYADLSWEKRVTQYSVEGKKIAVYNSVKEASIRTGIDANTISKSALQKKRLGSGYVWRYTGDTYKGEYRGKIKNKARPILQYSLEGKKIARYESVNKASIETGFSPATLLDCAFKRSKVSHGFVWRFEGEPYAGEYKHYQRGKPVTQHDRNGKKIQTYSTIEAAAKATGLTPDNIQKNVHGHNKTAGGFIWKFATPHEVRRLPDVKAPAYARTPVSEKAIIQYSLQGKKIREYASIADAARAHKTTPSNISFVLDKPQRTSCGFVWRTRSNRSRASLAITPAANKPRTVTQYDRNGKKVACFESTKKAEKETGISSSTISAVANGKLKTTGGYIWQYGDGPKRIDLDAYYASTIANMKKASKPVIKYSLDGKRIEEYASIAAAARAEGIAVKRISSVINGKTKSAVGYLWKLKEKTKAPGKRSVKRSANVKP